MAVPDPPPGGVLGSLRRICNTGLALVQNRVQLFGLEIEEQKTRFLRVFLLAGSMIFLANLAVLMVTLTIILTVGEGARVPVLIGLSVFFIAAAGLALVWLRRELDSAPPPFQQTLKELEEDRDWLTSHK